MKTTHLLNPGFRIKSSKPSKFFSFISNDLVKALILLFYILFLFQVVKSQNVKISKDNNLQLPGMTASINTSVTEGNKITGTPILKETVPTMLTVNSKKTIADTLRFINNNEAKAKAMVNSYFKGIDDADDHYRAKRSGKTAILLSTIIGTPVLGLLTTAVCSAATPTNKNLNIPNSKSVNNDAYMRGYKGESHYIKKHNTWPCYVLASVVWVGIAGLILR